MTMKLTVKVKLLPTSEQKASLIKTMEVFNDACNYISQIAWENQTFGQVGLHHLCYQYVRETYGLSAQLTVRAIGKVCESYRADKKILHIFKKHSALVYDQRILSFRGFDIVSILSLDGRFKIPIVFGEYAQLHRRMIRGQADMIYIKGNLFLCLCVDVPDGIPIEPIGTIEVD
jgi:predicted transposase